MYITELDLIKEKLAQGSADAITNILNDLIRTHEKSEKKKEMDEGVAYYEGHHAIDNRTRTYTAKGVDVHDPTKANNKLTHPHFMVQVKEKAAYIFGKPMTWTTGDEKLDKDIAHNVLGKSFHKQNKNLCKNSANKGVEWLHPYPDPDGKFKTVIIPAEQIIPVYDSKFEADLVQLLRYYELSFIDAKGGITKRKKVEWWFAEEVQVYLEDKSGTFRLQDDESGPHFHKVNTSTEQKVGTSWGKVPFIPFRNNQEEINDLRGIKSLIDDYDVNRSDLSNSLEEIQEALYVLKGYEGEELDGFMTNVKFYKVISVSAEQGSGVDVLKNEIPIQARKEHTEQLKRDLFALGMAVLHDPDKFGNSPSGVALKFMYAYLDLKADDYIMESLPAFEELFWFIGQFMNLDVAKWDLNFTFNKSMIINETEMVNNANLSIGSVSEDTRLGNHPWVDNVQEEREAMKQDMSGITLEDGGDV